MSIGIASKIFLITVTVGLSFIYVKVIDLIDWMDLL